MGIIAMLAVMSLGALTSVREQGREAATKATIAKLNAIIMRRYESYLHRRVPVNLSTLSGTATAQVRLYAIRDLMRMEMPDRIEDITSGPIPLPHSAGSISTPALWSLYNSYYNAHPRSGGVSSKQCTSAEMLYLVVSLGSPEDMEQFTQAEIGDTDGNGWLEFLDGWGRPIYFLRWAPGFTKYSDIQKCDWKSDGTFADEQVNYHDPFDPLRVDKKAFQLFPLIYSGGALSDYDISDGVTAAGTFYFWNSAYTDIWNAGTIFTSMGSVTTGSGVGYITNHHIEAR